MTWASWIDFSLGAWLVVAPFALGYSAMSRGAMSQDMIVGTLIAIFGLWSAVKLNAPRFTEWLLVIFGLWMIIGSFVLGTHGISRVTPNDVLIGTAVLIFGLVRVLDHGRTQKNEPTAA